jgi:hypothetical protein
LADIISAETRQAVFPAAAAFADHLRQHFGPATAAVLFYGSCLRQKSDHDLMMDFYVLVDRMAAAIANPFSVVLGALLPPNVYYMETQFESRVLRAKVAVMSVSSFAQGACSDAATSAIWARFSQPTAILYARSDEIRRRVESALAEAVVTMLAEIRPLTAPDSSDRDLWVRALQETYRAELRPESPAKAAELVDGDLDRYRAVTPPALAIIGAKRHTAAAAERRWLLRRIAGKSLNLLRLIKAAFTFRGGLEYAVWKIERHSGVKIELTDTERRRPLLTGLRLFLRSLRAGGFR